jgi:serine/threonine protein kinase
MELFGLPPKHLIEAATRKKMFFGALLRLSSTLMPLDSQGQPRIVPNSRGKKRRPSSKDLAAALRCTDPAFISFLEGCLMWEPSRRFTPDQALMHEFIMEAAVPPPTSRGSSMALEAFARDKEKRGEKRRVGYACGYLASLMLAGMVLLLQQRRL